MLPNFNFNDIEDVKKFAICLNKSFKSQGIESKQANVLEAISHAHGFNDWNAFCAHLKKLPQTTNTINISTAIQKDVSWDFQNYIHIDNGGYTIFYHFQSETLRIDTSFHGYSEDSHYFRMPIHALNQFIDEGQHLFDEYDDNESRLNQRPLALCNGTTFGARAFYLTIYNEFNKVDLYHQQDKVLACFQKIIYRYNNTFKSQLSSGSPEQEQNLSIDDVEQIFKTFSDAKQRSQTLNLDVDDILEERLLHTLSLHAQNRNRQFFYENRGRVINNMAMRYDHSYGLMDEKKAQALRNKMLYVWYCLELGIDNQTIGNKLQIDKISMSQLREEWEDQSSRLIFQKRKPF